MARVVGIDHLLICVSDFARSRAFYKNVLGFLGFKLKYDLGSYAGWSNGKTLFWITEADAEGKRHAHRIGNVGFHHYAFELADRKAVDALGAFLVEHGLTVADPPGSYNGDDQYYAVFFTDPDGMRLEAMHYGPAGKKPAAGASKKSTRKKSTRKKRK